MKILVCGGRDYDDYASVEKALNHCLKNFKKISIIEGGAKGADSLARKWAIAHAVEVTTINAKWGEFGKRAGIIRNIEMLEMNPDFVIAFPGGKGTAHMTSIAEKAGKYVWRPY